MNRTALRYFVAVAKAGSIREGAETLRIAQSAISRQIMGLEAELGVKLLKREPRGIDLTPAGEMFLRFARDELAQLARMRAEFDDLKRVRSGTVRLASIEPFAHRLLPQCIKGFLDLHPKIGIDIQVSDDAEVAEAVRKGEAALGLCFDAAAEDVRIVASVQDPLVALMRRSHPMARRKRLTVKQLAGADIMLPSLQTVSRQKLDAAAAAWGVTLRPLLESNSTQLRLSMVTGSEAIAVVSRIIASQWEDSVDIAVVPLGDQFLNPIQVDVFASRLRQLPPAAEAFASFLQKMLRATPARDQAALR